MLPADAAVGVRPIQIITGVDFSGNNLKEVGTGGLCNILGHPLGVTGSGVVDHQRLAGFGLSLRLGFCGSGRGAFRRFRGGLFGRRRGFRLRGGRCRLVGRAAGGKAKYEHDAQQ